ncbi:chemotaxis protein [Paenibacillus solani]|uniref:chemotaxis protein n=1 Tax=Paenibacillus solani TaxID=1705565 RepID=UPI003D2C4CDD
MKTQKIAVIIVHGLGIQKKDYADKFMKKLRETFSQISGIPDQELAMEAVHWADVFALREEEIIRGSILPHRLRYRRLRQYVIHHLADAVAYQPVESEDQNYEAVHRTISEALHRLSMSAGPSAPLCVISHSLGSVIASNFFYDLQFSSRGHRLVIDPTSPLERGELLTMFYTLGTTLPLWSMRYRDFDKPIEVPAEQLKQYHAQLLGEWVNFYDQDDILAYPLKSINEAYDRTVLQDIPVNVGNWLTSWNPLSHSGYFYSQSILDYIASNLEITWRATNPYK